jgi:hypothetical protein
MLRPGLFFFPLLAIKKPHFPLASIDAIQYFLNNNKNRYPNLNCIALLSDPETELK